MLPVQAQQLPRARRIDDELVDLTCVQRRSRVQRRRCHRWAPQQRQCRACRLGVAGASLEQRPWGSDCPAARVEQCAAHFWHIHSRELILFTKPRGPDVV